MTTQFQEFIIKIKYQNYFINNYLCNLIKETINKMFPKLNIYDIEILIKLSTYIIDIISYKFGFNKLENIYYEQWEQNNCRDIKGIVLLLLPFINDNDNSYLLSILVDLNHLLYSQNQNNIKKEILNFKQNKILSTHFKYGNMGIGLLNKNDNNDILLELYDNNNGSNEKLIYKIIHQNFITLLTTLEIMNGKYYINWINIVPINLINYKNTILYKSTIDKLKNENFKSDLITYNGLWLGDFYNVIRNKFYEEIKPIKWLIFNYETSETNCFYLINSLNKILNLNEILKIPINDYEDLYDYQKNNFYNILNNIIINTKPISFIVLKYCLIYFINNYNFDETAIILKQQFSLFLLTNENEDSKDEDFIKKDNIIIKLITNHDIKNFLIHIKEHNIGDFWNYLKLTLELFKNCAFSKYLIKNNKITDTYYYKPFNQDNILENTNINFKNIYNIAKSLSHQDINTWKLLPNNYLSLENPEDFFKKIYNHISYNKWININNNLKRQYKYKTIDYNIEINKLLLTFKNIFINLVFEELITNGLLNYFTTNLEITNRNKLPKNTLLMQKIKINNLKKIFEKNKNMWLNSYYYLTNNKFKNLPLIKVNKKNVNDNKNKYNLENYFDIIISSQSWPFFYAMDWLSQISFFKHYIYHQILYVTGATGQGKSTQVPKLLLYALKVINYKSYGKIICTQPRIPPTIENASRISEELGVPIYEPSNYTSNKIDTENFFIQYKHQYNYHTNNKNNHLSLTIVTDGTLLTMLRNNIILLKKYNNKFINETIYDIIIVDEAHEHNTNMDLILSLARQTCYLNNKIKLIIVSATMDNDEPIYRTFYKNINDMLMYPIKNIYLDHPILNNKFIINPRLMDRRYHISPPGETTQYKVTEYYLTNNVNEDNDKIASNIAQQQAYETVIEICNKSTFGEILLFANGLSDINDALEYLNKNMPPGNIALPYYAKLHENYKEIISNINIKINSIKNKRENIRNEWSDIFIEDITVPNNIYNRAIIIATNVAEASITIPSLKYVIDNGFSKINIYDPSINKSILQVEKIAESNRIQRKGRAGRVSDGEVYYMYNKKTRELIPPKYKITQENISNLINLLGNKELTNDEINDFNNINNLYINDLCDPNIQLIHNFEINSYYYNSGLSNIYLENYYSQIKDENYYLLLDNNTNFKLLFNTGQILNNILDNTGKFYLIHPYELKIERNILYEIIFYDKKNINTIPDNQYNMFFLELTTRNLLVNINNQKKILNNSQYYNNIDNYYKTELNIQIDILTSKYSLTNINAQILLAASAMNCEENVFELILLLELMTYTIKSIINLELCTITKFKKIYTNNKIKSDIIFLYDLLKNFKNDFNDLKVFNINKIKKMLLYICNDSFNKYKNNLLEYNQELDVVLWCKLYNLKNNNKNEKEYISNVLTSNIIIDIFKKDIEKKSTEIKKWCNDRYLNSNIFLLFLEKLYTSYLHFINLDSNNICILHDIEPIIWAKKFNSNFNKCLTDHTLEEKIIRSFMYGYPLQFAIVNNNKLITILNNIFEIDNYIDTLTNISLNLVFYLNYIKLESNDLINIGLLNEINVEWLLTSLPFIFDIIKKIDLNDNLILFFKTKLKNNLNRNNFVWNHTDVCILNSFYKNYNSLI